MVVPVLEHIQVHHQLIGVDHLHQLAAQLMVAMVLTNMDQISLSTVMDNNHQHHHTQLEAILHQPLKVSLILVLLAMVHMGVQPHLAMAANLLVVE